MTPLASLIRRSGTALIGAGALVILINAVITPLLPRAGSFADTVVSNTFLWRQVLAALAAVLLMFGAVGIYLRQVDVTNPTRTAAFSLALVGSALLLATEWSQIFEVRDLGLRVPDTLNRLDAEGVSLDDIGAMIAFSTLVVGWLSLAVVSRTSGLFPRHATTLVIAGFFATPFLSAAMPPLVAGAIGNTLLGAGLIWLGTSLRVPAEASRPSNT